MALVVQAPRRRVVDTPSDEPAWSAGHRIADRVFVPVRLAMLQAFGAMRQTLRGAQRRLQGALGLDKGTGLVSDPLLTQAMQAGTRVMQTQVRPLLTETVHRAGRVAQVATTDMLGLTVRWNQSNPFIQEAIDQQVGTLIRGITDESLRAVREIMRTSFQAGDGVPTIARRMTQVIGLTDRQAQTLQRFQAQLEAQGMAPGRIQQQVERATRRVLRYRATVIARTESLRSANLGNHLLWQDAEQQGLIPQTLRRVFIVSPDERLCNICRVVPSMNPVGVAINTPFATPVGTRLYPPIHVQCRCTVALKSFES